MGKSKVQAIVPKTVEEAEKLFRELGEAQRRIQEAKIEADREIEAIRKAVQTKIAHQEGRIAERFAGLAEYAENRREELTDEGSKSITLAAGTLAWRNNPPSIKLKGVEDVLEYLKKQKLTAFIRVKEEVNKEAMLQDLTRASKIPGVTVEQDEVFVAKPADGTGEITMAIKIDRRIKQVA